MDFGKGLKTGSIELMENIGLTQKMSSVMKDAGINVSDGINSQIISLENVKMFIINHYIHCIDLCWVDKSYCWCN